MAEIILLTVALTAFFVRLFYKSREKDIVRSYNRALSAHAKASNQVSDYSLKKRESALNKKEEELIQKESHINDLVRKRFADTVLDLSRRDYLFSTPAYAAIRNDPDSRKITSALSQKMKLLSPFDISSRISGESGEIYNVTLYSCTCKDFTIRKVPCKHMYRLASEVGALLSYDTANLRKQIVLLQLEKNSLEKERSNLEKERSKLKSLKKDLESIQNDSSQSSPWLSKLFADYYFFLDQAAEARIHSKAKSSAADYRKKLAQENHDLRTQNKMYEYQLYFYETIFPWLEEFKELSPQDAYASQILVEGKSEYETLRSWLSPEEYNSLSSSEKFQLALDRYKIRSKNKWEVGIEYERYIGYLCEQQGYHVTYTGANLGLEDMGRDLILSNGNKRIVIQCKRWAQEKTIHEKHIFQLFGSCILLEQQHSDVSVSGVFVTTAHLSETARACASRLNILVYENIPMQDYPVIKCNVSRSGEKIYHLPFDQQYDRIVIEPDAGEFYADSVASAEAAGFRRALRHNPNNS